MTTQLVGYKLKDISTNDIVQSWGGVWGQLPSIPNPLTLPNGDHVCAPIAGEKYGNYILDAWEIEEPPAPAPSVPEFISRRQFYHQLAIDSVITQAEALAAVATGKIPAKLKDYLGAIKNPSEKFAAEMTLSGETNIARANPLINDLGDSLAMTPEEIDDFFISAVLL